jgi:hypothetical protein
LATLKSKQASEAKPLSQATAKQTAAQTAVNVQKKTANAEQNVYSTAAKKEQTAYEEKIKSADITYFRDKQSADAARTKKQDQEDQNAAAASKPFAEAAQQTKEAAIAATRAWGPQKDLVMDAEAKAKELTSESKRTEDQACTDASDTVGPSFEAELARNTAQSEATFSSTTAANAALVAANAAVDAANQAIKQWADDETYQKLLEQKAAEEAKRKQDQEAAEEADRKRIEEEAAAEADRKRLEKEAAAEAEAERKRQEEAANNASVRCNGVDKGRVTGLGTPFGRKSGCCRGSTQKDIKLTMPNTDYESKCAQVCEADCLCVAFELNKLNSCELFYGENTIFATSKTTNNCRKSTCGSPHF